MSVASFPNYQPPPRWDDVAWETARIEESLTEGGAYTSLDTITLDPVDDDPTQPQSRSFTTSLATLNRWYRVVWVDGDAGESAPTIPGQDVNGVVSFGVEPYASAAELAAILKVNASSNATALDEVLLAAALEIDSEVGRADLAGAELALAAQVNIERAVEHWHARPVGFSILGLDSESPIRLEQDSWNRHANKLAPLKDEWGVA